MTTAATHKNGGMTKDLIVFVCILALAGLQFVIAYQAHQQLPDVCSHAFGRRD